MPKLATHSHIVQVVLNMKEHFSDGWLKTQQQLLPGSSSEFQKLLLSSNQGSRSLLLEIRGGSSGILKIKKLTNQKRHLGGAVVRFENRFHATALGREFVTFGTGN